MGPRDSLRVPVPAPAACRPGCLTGAAGEGEPQTGPPRGKPASAHSSFCREHSCWGGDSWSDTTWAPAVCGRVTAEESHPGQAHRVSEFLGRLALAPPAGASPGTGGSPPHAVHSRASGLRRERPRPAWGRGHREEMALRSGRVAGTGLRPSLVWLGFGAVGLSTREPRGGGAVLRGPLGSVRWQRPAPGVRERPASLSLCCPPAQGQPTHPLWGLRLLRWRLRWLEPGQVCPLQFWRPGGGGAATGLAESGRGQGCTLLSLGGICLLVFSASGGAPVPWPHPPQPLLRPRTAAACGTPAWSPSVRASIGLPRARGRLYLQILSDSAAGPRPR